MFLQWMRTKAFTIFLSFLMIASTASLALAEPAASPLGTIVTAGKVTVGRTTAPTGTTIFAGDKVISTQPALVNFTSGSRIEMTKAAATFARQGKTLVVQANQGLIRFNFLKGESVQINAGTLKFTAIGNSGHVGELGMNQSGQVVLTVSEGQFSAFNSATAVTTMVSPTNPLMAMVQTGAEGVAGGAGSGGAGGGAGAAGGAAAGGSAGGAAGGAAAGAASGAAGAAGSVAAGVAAGVNSAVGLGVGIHEATKSTSERQ
jgi:hypothetical protein